jgi:hypothetical protein
VNPVYPIIITSRFKLHILSFSFILGDSSCAATEEYNKKNATNEYPDQQIILYEWCTPPLFEYLSF